MQLNKQNERKVFDHTLYTLVLSSLRKVYRQLNQERANEQLRRRVGRAWF